MMAETYVLQAIQNGIASIQQSPAQLSDILTALNDNEMFEAQRWFSNQGNKIIVAPGFPSNPNQLPFIGVTVAEEKQTTVPIGYDYQTEFDNSGNATQYSGASFRGNLKGTIYTPNADLIVWLSSVVKWSLLSQYDWFGIEAGLRDIQVSLGDYEPSPGFLPGPGFIFARGVFLSGEYDQIFKTQPQLITSTSTIGTFTTYSTE